MKIGIFDSGIGGLSVLHQAMLTLPEADYIFYADVDHVPYGEKTREEVREFVDHAVGFLVNKGCQAIVLACNTATSVAISYLRDKYKLPIMGLSRQSNRQLNIITGKELWWWQLRSQQEVPS